MSLKSDRSIWEIREDFDVSDLVVRFYDPLVVGCSLSSFGRCCCA